VIQCLLTFSAVEIPVRIATQKAAVVFSSRIPAKAEGDYED
jgi:hypothetical protein